MQKSSKVLNIKLGGKFVTLTPGSMANLDKLSRITSQAILWQLLCPVVNTTCFSESLLNLKTSGIHSRISFLICIIKLQVLHIVFGKMKVVLQCWNLRIWFQGWCHLCQVFLKLHILIFMILWLMKPNTSSSLHLLWLWLKDLCYWFGWKLCIWWTRNNSMFVISTSTFLMEELSFFLVIGFMLVDSLLVKVQEGIVWISVFTFMSVMGVDVMIKHFRMLVMLRIIIIILLNMYQNLGCLLLCNNNWLIVCNVWSIQL